MDNTAAVATVIAILTPVGSFLASLAKQNHWPKQVNTIISLCIAVIGGVATVGLTGGLHSIGSDAGSILATGSILFTAMTAFYTAFKDSPLEQTLAAFPGHAEE